MIYILEFDLPRLHFSTRFVKGAIPVFKTLFCLFCDVKLLPVHNIALLVGFTFTAACDSSSLFRHYFLSHSLQHFSYSTKSTHYCWGDGHIFILPLREFLIFVK